MINILFYFRVKELLNFKEKNRLGSVETCCKRLQLATLIQKTYNQQN